MKKRDIKIYVALALLAGLLIGYVAARQKYTAIMAQKDSMIVERDQRIGMMEQKAKMMPAAGMTGVMMKEGKMMMTWQNGGTSMMNKDVLYPDGTKIMMNGEVTKADGSTMMMQEGDRMMMSDYSGK